MFCLKGALAKTLPCPELHTCSKQSHLENYQVASSYTSTAYLIFTCEVIPCFNKASVCMFRARSLSNGPDKKERTKTQ